MGLSQLRSFDDNKTKAIGLPFYYINKTYMGK
ncbi:unknown [Coprobacillus sp. CAG:698]|nr:unknown [Coprobacillus sp. CAG:698]